MNLKEIESYAKEQIKTYIPTWKFNWNNRKKSLGVCSYNKETIFLSKPVFSLSENSTFEKVRNTVLHEIAHALTPGNHHGKTWKRTLIQMGGDGNRLADIEYKVKGNYIYKCPNCDKVSYFYRQIKKLYACGSCCNKYNNGKYDVKFELVKV